MRLLPELRLVDDPQTLSCWKSLWGGSTCDCRQLCPVMHDGNKKTQKMPYDDSNNLKSLFKSAWNVEGRVTSSYLQPLQFRNDHGCRNTTVPLETLVCVHIFGRASACPSPAGSGDVARVKHLLAAVNTEQRLTSFTLTGPHNYQVSKQSLWCPQESWASYSK